MNGKRFTLVRHILEGMFVILFGVQTYLNISMRQEIGSLQTALRDSRAAASSPIFRVGDPLTPMPVETLDGRAFLMDPRAANREVMVLVVDPACNECREAVDSARKYLKGRAMIVLSVAKGGTREFAAQLDVSSFTYVVSLHDLPVIMQMKLSHPPTVLSLNSRGRITQVCGRPSDCV
jgi:hypothetical protein